MTVMMGVVDGWIMLIFLDNFNCGVFSVLPWAELEGYWNILEPSYLKLLSPKNQSLYFSNLYMILIICLDDIKKT